MDARSAVFSMLGQATPIHPGGGGGQTPASDPRLQAQQSQPAAPPQSQDGSELDDAMFVMGFFILLGFGSIWAGLANEQRKLDGR